MFDYFNRRWIGWGFYDKENKIRECDKMGMINVNTMRGVFDLPEGMELNKKNDTQFHFSRYKYSSREGITYKWLAIPFIRMSRIR